MSILRIFKLFAEAGIDKLLIMRAKKKNEPAPEDVQRRARVLKEENLTRKGTRRLSMKMPAASQPNPLMAAQDLTEETGIQMRENPMERNGMGGGGGGGGAQRRRRPSASAFEPAPPPPTWRGQLRLKGPYTQDEDLESPTSVEQHVGVDQELRTMKREIQEMKRQHETEIQDVKRQHENEIQDVKSENQQMKHDHNSVTSENQQMTREFQEMKRQFEALQKLVKKSPVAKRKSFRRLETSEGGSAYYQNQESGETVWTLPEEADVVE